MLSSNKALSKKLQIFFSQHTPKTLTDEPSKVVQLTYFKIKLSY